MLKQKTQAVDYCLLDMVQFKVNKINTYDNEAGEWIPHKDNQINQSDNNIYTMVFKRYPER